jgi:ankyrin repeat protein/uncharacterized protein YjbI with pentapeptide repeats/WD40 repeat protein
MQSAHSEAEQATLLSVQSLLPLTAEQEVLQAKKELLATQLEEIFIKEFEFLVDIAEGRAHARDNFKDKFASVVGIAGALVPGEVGGTAVTLALGAVQKGLSCMSQWEKDKAAATVKAFSVDRPKEKAQLAIRLAAHEFSTMMEFQLHRLKRQALPELALVAATRLLDYLVHQEQPSLELAALIEGIRHGRSGGGITAWKNTRLQTEAGWPFTWHAEGLFARVALQKEGMAEYLTHRDPHKVNMKHKGNETLPKYGYIQLSASAFAKEAKVYQPHIPGNLMKRYLDDTPYVTQTITAEDLLDYLEKCRRQPVQLNDFIAKKYQRPGGVISRFRGPLTDTDCTGAQLKNVDFCRADFTGSNFSHANLEGSWLMGATFTRIKAHAANFQACHMEQAIFTAADLTNAQMQMAVAAGTSFAGANMLEAQRGGMKEDASTNYRDAITQPSEMTVEMLRDKLKKAAEADIKEPTLQQALAMYVPLASAPDVFSNETKDLYDEVQQFIKDPAARVMLVHGNSGSGKSLFGRYVERQLWAMRQTYSIPLFISLPLLTGPKDRMIHEALEKKGFLPEHIKKLHSAKVPLLVIFDGYDEIGGRDNLYLLNKLEGWDNAKVIVSCRSQYLTGNYRNWFALPSQAALVERFILPFTLDKINTYIKGFVSHAAKIEPGWNVERYMTTLKVISNWQELAQEPFVLYTLLSILPQIEKDVVAQAQQGPQQFTRTQIYSKFTEEWFAKELLRLPEEARRKLGSDDGTKHITDIFQLYSRKLAFAMLEHGTLVAELPRTVHKIDRKTMAMVTISEGEWKEHFYAEDKDTQANLKIALLGSPLRRLEADRYSFIHKSFQEYFAALNMYEIMLELAQVSGEDAQRHFITGEACLNGFLLHQKDRATLQFMAERVNASDTGKRFQEVLFKIVSLSRHHPEITHAAANAITILNAARIPFSGMDFNHIYIAGADLTGAVLDHTNLDGANLKDANLSLAWVRCCSMVGAMTEGMVTESVLQLPTSAEDTLATNIAPKATHVWSTDNGSHILHYQHGMLHIWQYQQKARIASTAVDASLFDTACSNPHTLWSSLDAANVPSIKLAYIKAGTLYCYEIHAGIAQALCTLALPERQLQSTAAQLNSLLAPTSSLDTFASDYHLCFASSGSAIAYAILNKVYLYDVANKTTQIITTKDKVTALAFSRDDARLALGCRNGAVEIWQRSAQPHLENTLDNANHQVTSLCFAHQDNWLAGSHRYAHMRLWDIHTRQCLQILPFAGNIVGWSEKEANLYGVTANQVYGLPLKQAERSAHAAHTGAVTVMIYDPNSREVLSQSDELRGNEQYILQRKTQLDTGHCQSAEITHWQVGSLNSNKIPARLYQQLGQHLQAIHSQEISVAFATVSAFLWLSDTCQLITGHEDGSVNCWHINAQKKVLQLVWRQPVAQYIQEDTFLPTQERDEGVTAYSKLKLWIELGNDEQAYQLVKYYQERLSSSVLEGVLHTKLAFRWARNYNDSGPNFKLTPTSNVELAITRGLWKTVWYCYDLGGEQKTEIADHTALHQAVRSSDYAAMHFYAKRGIYVSAPDNNDDTPLHVASSINEVTAATWLLKRAANVNARNKSGQTPLHIAALAGHSAIVQLLLTHHADAAAKDHKGLTPLAAFAAKRDAITGKLSISDYSDYYVHSRRAVFAEIPWLLTWYQPALFTAAREGDVDELTEQLQLGVYVSADDEHGNTPLHICIQRGHVAAATLLLKRAALVNARNRQGQTPLHLAVLANHQELVQLLLRYQADITIRDEKGHTALDLAREKGRHNLCLLLEATLTKPDATLQTLRPEHASYVARVQEQDTETQITK